MGTHLTKYSAKDWCTDVGLRRIVAWARLGKTLDEIAEAMGITRSTLAKWRRQYNQIDVALNSGWDDITTQVETALVKRALGYEYTETYEEVQDGPLGQTVKTGTRTKAVVPDVTSQIFFLKNRAPDRWSDRKRLDIDVDVAVTEQRAQVMLEVVDMALQALNLSPDQRARLPELMAAAARAKGLVDGRSHPEALQILEAEAID